MTTRLRVDYTSRYKYADTIRASYNELRLTPVATPWQNPLEFQLRVDEATWQTSYVDYWGTQVRSFEAHNPHRELSIRASQRWPDRRHLYAPGAVVDHRVPLARTSWSYFVRRCYSEGLSKARVSALV